MTNISTAGVTQNIRTVLFLSGKTGNTKDFMGSLLTQDLELILDFNSAYLYHTRRRPLKRQILRS